MPRVRHVVNVHNRECEDMTLLSPHGLNFHDVLLLNIVVGEGLLRDLQRLEERADSVRRNREELLDERVFAHRLEDAAATRNLCAALQLGEVRVRQAHTSLRDVLAHHNVQQFSKDLTVVVILEDQEHREDESDDLVALAVEVVVEASVRRLSEHVAGRDHRPNPHATRLLQRSVVVNLWDEDALVCERQRTVGAVERLAVHTEPVRWVADRSPFRNVDNQCTSWVEGDEVAGSLAVPNEWATVGEELLVLLGHLRVEREARRVVGVAVRFRNPAQRDEVVGESTPDDVGDRAVDHLDIGRRVRLIPHPAAVISELADQFLAHRCKKMLRVPSAAVELLVEGRHARIHNS